MLKQKLNLAPHPSPRRVIVNADDFGLNQAVNQGILRAYQQGIVTSTSLMVTMPGVDEAVSMAKANPKLGVGLHLNLTYGKPVLDAAFVPSLINKHGKFHSPVKFMLRLKVGKIDRHELKQEISAQFRRFFTFGLPCTHFDGHRHIHCVPEVFELAIQEARRYNINKCRISVENYSTQEIKTAPLNPLYYIQQSKAKLLDHWSKRCKELALQHQMSTPKSFFGIVAMSETSERNFFCDLLAACADETNPIFCSPCIPS